MPGNGWMTPVVIARVLTMVVIAAGGGEGSQEADYETFSASECVVKQPRQIVLSLTCKNGQMVRLLRIFLGNSTNGTCQYQTGDCTMDLPSTENYSCIGTESCSIKWNSVNLRRQIPKCKEASTYVQALYQCIPASDTVSVCDRSRSLVVGQRGFVATPGYPFNYPNNMDCNITLVAPYDEQRLKLFVIDLNLEPNGTACFDWLQVFDGFQSNTLCGTRTRYWMRDSTQRTIHIHFSSNGSQRGKGFWLYYEAFPFIATVPPTPATLSVSPTTSSSTTFLQPPMESNSSRAKAFPAAETIASSSSSYSASSSSSNKVIFAASDASTMPLGVVLAVVIALIICILLILLIIVLVKSRSTRRHLSTETRLPESDERMLKLEREQSALCPATAPLRSSSCFRDSEAGDKMPGSLQQDALLSAYTPSRMKDVF